MCYRSKGFGQFGPAGFEPTTSCTPSKRASQAALRPVNFVVRSDRNRWPMVRNLAARRARRPERDQINNFPVLSPKRATVAPIRSAMATYKLVSGVSFG
jgi:hypothetical protein